MRLTAFLTAILTLSASADDYTVILLDKARQRASTEPEWRLVMFTASWCGPCRAWKRDYLKKTEQLLPVEQIDIDKHPEVRRTRTVDGKTISGIYKVPTFWLVKKGQQVPTRAWTGGRIPEQIKQLLDNPYPPSEKRKGFLSGLFK